MAGIVAMGVAAALGMVMGLSNTAIFTSSSVVFVAVALWVQSRVAKSRTPLQGLPPQLPDGVARDRAAERPSGQLPGGEGTAA